MQKKPQNSSYKLLFFYKDYFPRSSGFFPSDTPNSNHLWAVNRQRNDYAAFIRIRSCNGIVSDCASVKQTGNRAVIIARSADLSSDTCKNAAAFLLVTGRKMERTGAEGFQPNEYFNTATSCLCVSTTTGWFRLRVQSAVQSAKGEHLYNPIFTYAKAADLSLQRLM